MKQSLRQASLLMEQLEAAKEELSKALNGDSDEWQKLQKKAMNIQVMNSISFINILNCCMIVEGGPQLPNQKQATMDRAGPLDNIHPSIHSFIYLTLYVM